MLFNRKNHFAATRQFELNFEFPWWFASRGLHTAASTIYVPDCGVQVFRDAVQVAEY